MSKKFWNRKETYMKQNRVSIKKTQIYIRTKKKCGYQNKNSKDKINSRLDPKSSELRISREMDTQNLELSDRLFLI